MMAKLEAILVAVKEAAESVVMKLKDEQRMLWLCLRWGIF